MSSTRRLKVLFVTSSYPRGSEDSASVFLRCLAEHLSDLGIDIHVIAPADRKGSITREGAITVHRFQYLPARIQHLAYGSGMLPNLKRAPSLWLQVPFFILALARTLLRLLAKQRFDIIHAHWLLPQGMIGAIGARLFGVPLIVSAHGSDAFALRGRLLTRIKHWIVRASDRWTANTAATAAAAGNPKVPEPRIIPMGVDVALFSSGNRSTSRKTIPEEEFIVLFVGRLVENKGCRDLIQALSLLGTDIHSRTRLWIVGDGGERPRLEGAARGFQIEARTEFFGAVGHHRLADFYAAADLVVVPSTPAAGGAAEGQNLVVLEAFAARVCVVATRLGGIPSMVRDRDTGLLVEPGDPKALAKAIESLLRDADLRRRLRTNAFAEVSKYDWRRIADEFCELYQDAIKARMVAGSRAANKA